MRSYLKKILTTNKDATKKRVAELKKNATTCSAIHHSIHPKLKNPGNFSIPCVIEEYLMGKSLCDLRASVSIIFILCTKSLAYKSPFPQTVIPCDFVVLDIEEDSLISIILGRPFLAIAGVIIDVKKGTLVMELSKDREIEFNMFGEVDEKSSCLKECTKIERVSSYLWRILSNEEKGASFPTLEKI